MNIINEENYQEHTFDKLKELQILIKKESSLKSLSKQNSNDSILFIS